MVYRIYYLLWFGYWKYSFWSDWVFRCTKKQYIWCIQTCPHFWHQINRLLLCYCCCFSAHQMYYFVVVYIPESFSLNLLWEVRNICWFLIVDLVVTANIFLNWNTLRIHQVISSWKNGHVEVGAQQKHKKLLLKSSIRTVQTVIDFNGSSLIEIKYSNYP